MKFISTQTDMQPSDVDVNVPSDVDSEGTDDDIGFYIHQARLNSGENHVGISSLGHSREDVDASWSDDSQKQLVVFDPCFNTSGPIAAVPISSRPLTQKNRKESLSVDTFTVQCAECLKWRLIPDQKKYEEIREHITDRPFVCESASEWREDISCDAPTDIEQDGTRLWAIDKPNIAQPPPMWERLLRIRPKGSSKFADVYYKAPNGRKLRSIPEVQKFLEENKHVKEIEGVTIGRFSFQSPKPLEEDYVRKRPPGTHGGTNVGIPASHQASPDEPLAWAAPEDLPIAEPVAWAGPGTPEFCQVRRSGSKKVKRNR